MQSATQDKPFIDATNDAERRPGPRRDPRGRRPRVRGPRRRVSQGRRRPLLREGARDLREGSRLMEVGMALAIKTLADDFQPLDRGLQVVRRRGVDGRRPRLRLHLDERAPLRGRRLVAVAAADPGEHRRAHLAHPVAHECVLAAAAPAPASRRRRGDGRHLVEWSARPRVRHRLGRGGVRRVRRRPQDAVEPVLGGDGDPPPRDGSRAVHVRGQALLDPAADSPDHAARATAVPVVGRWSRVRSCSTTRACAASTLRAARCSVPSTSKA